MLPVHAVGAVGVVHAVHAVRAEQLHGQVQKHVQHESCLLDALSVLLMLLPLLPSLLLLHAVWAFVGAAVPHCRAAGRLQHVHVSQDCSDLPQACMHGLRTL
jgi:hypothetical protein